LSKDFDPCFKIGWNDRGIVLLAQVKDNVIRTARDDAILHKGDSVEVFVTPKRGSSESYRLVVAPGTDPKSPEFRSRFYDHREATTGEELTAEIAGKRTPDGYLVEIFLPWKNLKTTPGVGTEFGMQLLINDDDGRGDQYRFQAVWHPGGDPGQDPLAYQTFRLAAEPSSPIRFTRSDKRDPLGLYPAVPPYPFPVHLPPLGAEGEDPSCAADWSSAVKAGPAGFVAELAVPWETLAKAGINKDQMMINLSARGPLPGPPMTGQGFERLITVPDKLTQPRTLAVRLHFAELEDARPGERVFDVRLQGEVVLADFDIAAAAGGGNRAVVKDFRGIVAARALTLELVPKAKQITDATAPILCGLEILDNTEDPK